MSSSRRPTTPSNCCHRSATACSVSSASREDNFFDCGGHSLLAIRLANRLERDFQRGITLRQVLESPTLAGLIALCRA